MIKNFIIGMLSGGGMTDKLKPKEPKGKDR